MSFPSAIRGGEGPLLVLLHGFTDTPRTWDLVRPPLERRHEVFAPALPGHAGGPAMPEPSGRAVADGLERILDAAGIDTAHIAGNSMGGLLALEMAARGRAESVVALAPAGGFMPGDDSFRSTTAHFKLMLDLLPPAARHADAIAATLQGRLRATEALTVDWEHIPADLIAHQIRGAAACTAAPALVEQGAGRIWELEAERITCPVRIVWGTEDRLLPWPSAAERYRREWLPNADWVVLEGVGHSPQLDIPLETAELILGFTSP